MVFIGKLYNVYIFDKAPVYGAVDDGQAGLNDQPLEFGSVQEPSGPHPYGEGMVTTESAVISQGPQMAIVSHQPETYSSISTGMTSYWFSSLFVFSSTKNSRAILFILTKLKYRIE